MIIKAVVDVKLFIKIFDCRCFFDILSTLGDHLRSPLIYGVIRVANLFIFLCCVALFVFLLCLCEPNVASVLIAKWVFYTIPVHLGESIPGFPPFVVLCVAFCISLFVFLSLSFWLLSLFLQSFLTLNQNKASLKWSWFSSVQYC